jgi:hypothetical protein
MIAVILPFLNSLLLRISWIRTRFTSGIPEWSQGHMQTFLWFTGSRRGVSLWVMKSLKLLLFAVITAFFTIHSGCASKGDLDPTGVYQGDALAYNADKVITESYASFDVFVKWEFTHRAALSKWPEIRRAADDVRANAKIWIDSAIAIREAYRIAPTEENRKSLQASLAIIRGALAAASAYYSATSSPQPSS